MKRSEKITLLVFGILSAGLLAVMDVFLLPKIKGEAGGINAFDLQMLGYTHEAAVRFLLQLSDAGRGLYLHAQLPVDFAFLVCYTVLFVLALRVLLGNHRMIFLPLLLAAADLAENISVLLMLRSDKVSTTLTSFASGATLLKSILTYMTVAAVLVFALHRFLAARKEKRKVRP